MATIAENLQTIIDIKADIKTAIENKGVTVGDASFSEYAGKIDSIEAGGSATIDVEANGIKLACSTFTEVPSVFSFNNVTNTRRMFEWCESLITAPQIDTSNVTNMFAMFRRCTHLESVPLYSTSNVTDMSNMFEYCWQLASVPLFNTSKVTSMRQMFYDTMNLIAIPQFDTSNVTDMYKFCESSDWLQTIPQLDTSKVDNITNMFAGCSQLKNLGGFINLGKGFTGDSSKPLYLDDTTRLTYESCMNVINNVYDMNLNTEFTGNPSIWFDGYIYSSLTEDDLAIATAKGWSIYTS